MDCVDLIAMPYGLDGKRVVPLEQVQGQEAVAEVSCQEKALQLFMIQGGKTLEGHWKIEAPHRGTGTEGAGYSTLWKEPARREGGRSDAGERKKRASYGQTTRQTASMERSNRGA
jgi:hypothetical protein